MKLAALILGLFALLASAFAVSLEPTTRDPASPVYSHHTGYELPGVALAESLSQITGTAISPLLGVSSVGAWRYYKTPEAVRHELPWFCHPAAWSVGFVILGLCFLKDVFGTASPTMLKKPFDLAELFENKLSAIVAGSAFVPIIAAELARHSREAGPSAALLSEMHYAAMPFLTNASAWVATALTVTAAVVGFLLIFLSSHAINVLIALSPFTTVDAALKLVKAGLLSLVTATAFINPWLGAAVCFAILLVAGLVAPWAFRFTLFGTVFATDIFRFRFLRRASRSDASQPKSFTSRRFAGIPVRTLGRLMRNEEGQLIFRYRPWVILPKRNVALPDGSYALSKGLLCPDLLHCEDGGTTARTLLMLLPRYSSQEDLIAERLSLTEVRDGGVLKGFKAIRNWFAEILGLGRRKNASACIS